MASFEVHVPTSITMPPDGRANSNTDSDLEAGQQAQTEMVSSFGGRGGQTTEWSRSLPLVSLSPQPQRLAKIHRVREQLRRVACDQFTPQTVPIGPYHQQLASFSFPSAEDKNKAVQYLEQRLRPDANLAGLKLVLDRLVDEVRACYSHLPDHWKDSEAFSRMLLFDGCYLLDFFIDLKGSTTGSSGGGNQIELTKDKLTKDNTSAWDILYLVENQIPLSVLDEMLSYYLGGTATEIYAADSISGPVEYLLQQQLYISKERRPRAPSTSTSSDLLHLVYSYFRRQPHDDDEPPPAGAAAQGRSYPTTTGRWRRATDYRRYADLQFRCREFKCGEQWTILDMRLEGGTLYVPFLRVTISTWTMLRNLMALELEEQKEERPVTAYCLFMSQVACTAEDVRLLQAAKVLEHFMANDEEAAKGFAYLCDGVTIDIDRLDRNYLKPVWHDLHKRCGMRVHNFKGFFRERYCSNVFYRFMFCIAIIIFVSEVTQSIYAVVAYHKPARN